MKTLLVTACGAKKHSEPMEAYKLYKSSRIRAVYNRRNGCDMAILSAKYGLVGINEIISPYEQTITEQRILDLMPSIIKKILHYDKVVYYKGGANRLYFDCIKDACDNNGVSFFSVGYAHMGDIDKIGELIKT